MNLISGFEKGAYSFERKCADKNLEFKKIELAEKRLEYWKKFLGNEFDNYNKFIDDNLLGNFDDVIELISEPKLQYQFVHFLSFLTKYQNLT